MSQSSLTDPPSTVRPSMCPHTMDRPRRAWIASSVAHYPPRTGWVRNWRRWSWATLMAVRGLHQLAASATRTATAHGAHGTAYARWRAPRGGAARGTAHGAHP